MTRAECVNVRIRCSMRSELFWREWRGSSSPPSSKPGDCAGSFERPVPFRADPRRLQALIQNSRAASRGGLRLGGLVILFVAHGGPRQGIGGGPVHHAGLDKRERLAGPSVPSFATPYSWVELTPRLSERAGWRTPARGDRSAAPQHQWWLSPNDRKWLEFRDRPQDPLVADLKQSVRAWRERDAAIHHGKHMLLVSMIFECVSSRGLEG